MGLPPTVVAPSPPANVPLELYTLMLSVRCCTTAGLL